MYKRQGLLLTLVEALVRVAIFLGYLFLISRMKEIHLSLIHIWGQADALIGVQGHQLLKAFAHQRPARRSGPDPQTL